MRLVAFLLLTKINLPEAMSGKNSTIIEQVSAAEFKELTSTLKLLVTKVEEQNDELAELRRQVEKIADADEMEYTLHQLEPITGLKYQMLYKYVKEGILEAKQTGRKSTIKVSASALREFRGRLRQPKDQYN
jgi:hypothetical protein